MSHEGRSRSTDAVAAWIRPPQRQERLPSEPWIALFEDRNQGFHRQGMIGRRNGGQSSDRGGAMMGLEPSVDGIDDERGRVLRPSRSSQTFERQGVLRADITIAEDAGRRHPSRRRKETLGRGAAGSVGRSPKLGQTSLLHLISGKGKRTPFHYSCAAFGHLRGLCREVDRELGRKLGRYLRQPVVSLGRLE